MDEPLRGCNCANCQRWMSESRPTPLSAEEGTRRRAAYEAHRRQYRIDHPIKTVEGKIKHE